MTATAKMSRSRGAHPRHLPQEFPTAGVGRRKLHPEVGEGPIPTSGDLEMRRRRFLKLAGSCPDFPEAPRHPTLDRPREFAR
jgi:antitoxin VapB